jgi:hypothetical protein
MLTSIRMHTSPTMLERYLCSTRYSTTVLLLVGLNLMFRGHEWRRILEETLSNPSHCEIVFRCQHAREHSCDLR